MKTICCTFMILVYGCCEAQSAFFAQHIPYQIDYATRVYWRGDEAAKSRALVRFKINSESMDRPVGERGYCKLYLGKSALESGDIERAIKLFARADEKTDAFWGDEILLEYYEIKRTLKEYEKKRNELLRSYTIRRDSILQGNFDVRRIWWMLSCSLLMRGTNRNPDHYLRYRFMYCHYVDEAMRLSLYLDYCNERISELSGKKNVVNDPKKESPEFKFSIPSEKVTLKPKSWFPNLIYWGPAGCVEGSGMLYRYSKGNDYRWEFSVCVRKEILAAAGVEYNVRTIYKGVIQDGKVFLYDVDGNLFESPFFSIDKGCLKVKVQYRTCRTPRNNPILYFFGWQGVGELHTEYISFRLPYSCW